MNTNSSSATRRVGGEAISAPPTDLNVLLAYENMAAALYASESLATITRQEPAGLVVKLSPWSFAALAEPQWRVEAVVQVRRAHLLVIAAWSAAPDLPVAIEVWLRSCLRQPRAEPQAVAALFRHGAAPDGARSPRLRSVRRIAQEAGCAFFAPGVGEQLSRSASIMSPCR